MFKEARLKLTGWYLLIIMVISISFSGIIYGMVNNELERFAHSPRFMVDQVQLNDPEDLLDASRGRLIMSLLEINGVILLISGSLGYVLAGKTLSPIQKMLEEQKRFVGDASHELRTPLTALKAMLEVGLRDKKMDLKEAKELISESIEETNKLKNLSDSLLELARENVNGRKILLEKLKVRDLVAEAIKNVDARAAKKKIEILVNTNGTTVKGNRDKLIELLVILLDNAIKYSSKNTRVKIIAKENQHQAIIKVIDQGQGIEEKDLPHIFERFYRTDVARGHQDEGGYGLGLAIAQKIVEENNGKIFVASVVNKGSEFKIILPIFS
jgi:signal transduction histidine kinase